MTVNGPLTPAQRSSVACAHARRARGGPCCRLAPDSRQRRTANGGEWAGGSSRLRRSRAGLGMQLSSWQKRHVIRIFLTHHSSRAGVAQDFASQPQGGQQAEAQRHWGMAGRLKPRRSRAGFCQPATGRTSNELTTVGGGGRRCRRPLIIILGSGAEVPHRGVVRGRPVGSVSGAASLRTSGRVVAIFQSVTTRVVELCDDTSSSGRAFKV